MEKIKRFEFSSSLQVQELKAKFYDEASIFFTNPYFKSLWINRNVITDFYFATERSNYNFIVKEKKGSPRYSL